MSGKKHLWIPVLSILALLNACKKQDIQSTQSKNVESERTFGAVLETPSQLTDVPLMVSTRYMALKTRSVGPTKGKGSGGSTTTSDATAPVVSITSPADGSSVTGTITVGVSATDNVAVASVSLSVDGAIVATINTAPYNFSWNSGTVADGVHTLTAKATDAAGNWSNSSVSVSKNTTIVNPPTSTIPASFSLVTPPVGYQGGEGSCVAFAVGYGARSIEEYYKTGAGSYSYSNSFSPEFLYNQTKFGDCGSGTSVTTVLDFIKNTGVCTWNSMPYSYTNGCTLMPTSNQLAEAANYKIASYSWLYSSDMTTIKSQLLKNHAVIASLVPDDSFVNAGPGFIWKTYTANKTAGHIVIIVGYDDAKNAYKIMNSWGTSWGDSGYSWIDYNFFPYTGSGVCYVIN